MTRLILCVTLITVVAACGQDVAKNMTVETKLTNHKFSVRGRGDVIALESIPINVPYTISMRLNIKWLIPEFSRVAAGDVVARFEELEIVSQRNNVQVQIANQALSIRNHTLDSDTAQTKIAHQSTRVEGETAIA